MSQRSNSRREIPAAARVFGDLQADDALTPGGVSAARRTGALFLAFLVLGLTPLFLAAYATGVIGDPPAALAKGSNSGPGGGDDDDGSSSSGPGSGGDDDDDTGTHTRTRTGHAQAEGEGEATDDTSRNGHSTRGTTDDNDTNTRLGTDDTSRNGDDTRGTTDDNDTNTNTGTHTRTGGGEGTGTGQTRTRTGS
jgi:hypothetical protein